MSFDLSDYVDVAERIRIFKEKYPNGSLQPLDITKPFDVITVGERMFVVYVAAAYRDADDKRPGVGMAWESFPGKTPYTRDSELMNAETSAWGRAIIAALAADTQKIASADEVRNRRTEAPPQGDATVIQMVAKPMFGGEQVVQRSREEMIQASEAKSQAMKQKATATSSGVSEAQVKLLGKLSRERGIDLIAFASEQCGRTIGALTELSKKEASAIISNLMNQGA
jgi:hypothetical protein